MMDPMGTMFDFSSDDVQKACNLVNDTTCSYHSVLAMHMHSMQKNMLDAIPHPCIRPPKNKASSPPVHYGNGAKITENMYTTHKQDNRGYQRRRYGLAVIVTVTGIEMGKEPDRRMFCSCGDSRKEEDGDERLRRGVFAETMINS
jgi:hypothetical protein